jgi:hypothetical protein
MLLLFVGDTGGELFGRPRVDLDAVPEAVSLLLSGPAS